jgi:hypothetical protein
MKNELTTAAQNETQLSFYAKKINTSKEVLKIVLNTETIKKQLEHNEEQTRQALQMLLFGIAESYYPVNLRDSDGITQNARLVLAEITALCTTKYKLFSIDDIKQAFRAAAAEEIKIDFNTYGQKLTVPKFTAVMNAYKKYKNKIKSKFETARLLIESRKDDDQKEEKNEAAQKDVINQYKQAIENYKNGQKIKEIEIPIHWGEILDVYGLLKVNAGERAEIWKESQKRAVIELKTEIMSDNKTGFHKESLRKTLKGYLQEVADGESGAKTKDIKSRATRIYKRAVVIYSIQNSIS